MLAAVLPAAQAAISKTYSARQTLSINGVACPELMSWSGGDASAPVVVEALSAGTSPKKHLGNFVYEPIIMVVTAPLSPALQNSLADLCANRTSTQTLLLTDVDNTKIQATNAQLIEARFPALDGGSKNHWRLTLVFRPESTHPVAGGSTASAGTEIRPKGALSSNFRFALGSFPSGQVAGIEAFTITRAASAGVGAERDYTASPGATQIPDLNIIVTQAGVAAWTSWRDDFIVQGNSDDPKEKNGSLDILGPDLQTVLLPLQLSHVGIKRFVQIPSLADNGPNFYRAELYCESMSVASSPVTNSSAPTTTSAPAATPAETAPADTAKTPEKEPDKTPTASTETAPADSKSPVDPKAPPKEPAKTPETTPAESSPATAAPAASAKSVTNPEDKGPRDPADFPRADGTRRTQYSAVREIGFLQETANYTAKAKSDVLMAFYEKNLKSGGWEETARYENDNGTDRAHQIISTWKKANRTASLTFMDASSGYTEIQAVVQERK